MKKLWKRKKTNFKPKYWKPPLGTVVKQEKLILNKDSSFLEVVILSIEHYEDEIHFVLKIGGKDEIRIVGEDEWFTFLKFLEHFEFKHEQTLVLDLHK